jgi:hypothetical protein
VPLSALVAEEVADATSAIEPERFFPQGHAWLHLECPGARSGKSNAARHRLCRRWPLITV